MNITAARHFYPMTAVVALLILALSGCNTSRMRDTWQAEGFSKNQLDKVLVICNITNKTNRILFEDGLVRTLQNDGLTAYSSYDVMPEEKLTKEKVIAYVKNHDINYVIVTKVDNIKIDKDYVPASAVTYVTGSYGCYYCWNYNTHTMVNEEYTDTQTTVMLVTTIHDAKTEKPVWAGVSKTFEIDAVSTAGKDVAVATLRSVR